MESADMMVSLFVLMIVGVLLAYLVRRIQSHLLRWQSQHSAER
jgi:NitT/TauT family transport system permease protein